MRKSGFTLIELLVVIAIIAILAAILFPVFARAREKARQTSCVSNIKQLTLGVLMYSQDYDGSVPYWYEYVPYPVVGGYNVYYWWEMYQPYIKNAQIFRCPSGSPDAASLGAPATYTVATHYVPVWYAPAGYYIPNTNNTAWYWMGGVINAHAFACVDSYPCSGNDARIASPATAGLLVEGYGAQNPANLNQAQIGFSGFKVPGNSYRHNDGWNVGYFDGHAKWQSCNGFWTSRTAREPAVRPTDGSYTCPDTGEVSNNLSSVF